MTVVDTQTTIRDLERASIRRFVESCTDHFKGRTLDFGAGEQPYREIVTRVHGQYHPWDRTANPGSCAKVDAGADDALSDDWDAIICTQVVQYVSDVASMFEAFAEALMVNTGVLVLTYPTTWPEVEDEDLHRFTRSGIEGLLISAGFALLRHETRALVPLLDAQVSLGGGVVAKPAW